MTIETLAALVLACYLAQTIALMLYPLVKRDLEQRRPITWKRTN